MIVLIIDQTYKQYISKRENLTLLSFS